MVFYRVCRNVKNNNKKKGVFVILTLYSPQRDTPRGRRIPSARPPNIKETGEKVTKRKSNGIREKGVVERQGESDGVG